MLVHRPGYGTGMTQRTAAGDPSSHMADALRDIEPYVAAVSAVALLGSPAEIAVAIVRRLRGRSGVAVGPGGTNLLNGVAAVGVAHRFRQDTARWQQEKRRGIPGWGGIGGLAYLTLSPAVAARWRRGAVLPDRTPLWGALLSPIGLLQIALVLVALVRASRARSAGAPGPS